MMRTITKNNITQLNVHHCKNTFRSDNDSKHNLIGSKLMKSRKSAGLTLRDVCQRMLDCGIRITPSTVSRWESGEVIPNAYQLVALSIIYGINENISWFSSIPHSEILNKEGREKLRSYEYDLIASGLYKTEREKLLEQNENESKIIELPVSNLAVSAGYGEYLFEQDMELMPFPECAVPAGADFGLIINGDSMYPTYNDGQLVWVHKTEELSEGDIGIFAYDGNGYIKEYHEVHSNDTANSENFGTQILLVSHNEKYSPIVISPNAEFGIIGKVLR